MKEDPFLDTSILDSPKREGKQINNESANCGDGNGKGNDIVGSAKNTVNKANGEDAEKANDLKVRESVVIREVENYLGYEMTDGFARLQSLGLVELLSLPIPKCGRCATKMACHSGILVIVADQIESCVFEL